MKYYIIGTFIDGKNNIIDEIEVENELEADYETASMQSIFGSNWRLRPIKKEELCAKDHIRD